MSNFEQKKKTADEALLVANDFLKSRLAKEIFLKDDEVTPKEINPKIEKELRTHLDLNLNFIKKLRDQDLPAEIFTLDYKQKMNDAISSIDKVRVDIPKNFNFTFFDAIYVQNDGKFMIFNYIVNEKFKASLYVSTLLVTDHDKGANKVVSSKDGIIQSGILLNDYEIYPYGNYTIVAMTNDGQKIKVSII